MVEISSSGSGEGPGWATAPGYSTARFLACPITRGYVKQRVVPCWGRFQDAGWCATGAAPLVGAPGDREKKLGFRRVGPAAGGAAI